MERGGAKRRSNQKQKSAAESSVGRSVGRTASMGRWVFLSRSIKKGFASRGRKVLPTANRFPFPLSPVGPTVSARAGAHRKGRSEEEWGRERKREREDGGGRMSRREGCGMQPSFSEMLARPARSKTHLNIHVSELALALRHRVNRVPHGLSCS